MKSKLGTVWTLFLAWGSVVGILLNLRQARWERCNAEVVQAVFVR